MPKNKKINDIRAEEYRKLLMELYRENQSFLNKAIFSVSTLAIPFLFNILSQESKKLCHLALLFLIVALIGFCGTIVCQIYSLKIARDGCDKSLEENQESKKCGEQLFDKARNIDICREIIFVISLACIVIALVIKTLN